MGFWPFGGRTKSRTAGSKSEDKQTISGPVLVGDKQGIETLSSGEGSGDQERDNPVKPLSKSQTEPMAGQQRSRAVSRRSEKDVYQHPSRSRSSIGPENFDVEQRVPTLHAKRAETDLKFARDKSSKRKAEEYAREREIRAMSSAPIPIPKRPNNTYRSDSPLQRETKNFPTGLSRRNDKQGSEISLPLPDSMANVDYLASQSSFKIGLLAALSPRPNVKYDSYTRNENGKQSFHRNPAIQKAIAEEDVSDQKRIDELADDLDAGGLRELMERDRRRRDKKKELDKERLKARLERRAAKQREEETRKARVEAFVRGSGLNVGPEAPPKAEASGTRTVKASQEVKEQKDGRKPDNPFTDFFAGTSKSTKGTAGRQATKDADNMFADFFASTSKTKKSAAKKRVRKEPENPFTDFFAHKPGPSRAKPTAPEAAAATTTTAAAKPSTPLSSSADVPVPIRNPFEDEEDMDFMDEKDRVVTPDIPLPAKSPLRKSGPQPAAQSAEPSPVALPTRSPAREAINISRNSRQTSMKADQNVTGEKSGSKFDGRRISEQTGQRLNAWTSFFSRGTRQKFQVPERGDSATAFANTSRESVQRNQATPVAPERSFRTSESSVPKRTLSKFREDLPELPLSSPSDSRLQSSKESTNPVPEPSLESPTKSRAVQVIDATLSRSRDDEHGDYDEHDESDIAEDLERPKTPDEWTGGDQTAKDARGQLSRSMASVDSEASWLSGRPSKRRSGASGLANANRQSHSSLRQPATKSSEKENLAEPSAQAVPAEPLRPDDFAKDVSFESKLEQKSTGTPNDTDLGKESSELPVATPDALEARKQSKSESTDHGEDAEGDDDDDGSVSPGSVEIIDAPVLRAHSVEYKGHARAVSAGSAKLLDIRRVSTHSDLGSPRSPTIARKSTLGLNTDDDPSPATPTTIEQVTEPEIDSSAKPEPQPAMVQTNEAAIDSSATPTQQIVDSSRSATEPLKEILYNTAAPAASSSATTETTTVPSNNAAEKTAASTTNTA